jgi:beta-lactam-binding protein with PASTA domain
MASDADRAPPAEDTIVEQLEDQPTRSNEDWPVSDLYLVEPAEEADQATVAEAAVFSQRSAPAAVPTEARRRFPPDPGAGLLVAIAGTIGVLVLVVLLFALREDDPATARTSPSVTTTTEQQATTPVPASAEVTLRDLTGMPVSEARAVLQKQGLRAKVSRLQSDRPRDEVLTQEPPAGSTATKGDIVSLLVSSGASTGTTGASETVRVPSVVGLSVTEATRAMRDAGLEPHIRRVTSDQEPGTVLDQSPAAEESVETGSGVRLDVAKAPPAPTRFAVPDVVGRTAAAARRELRSAGFTVTVVSMESEEPLGTVLSQSPRAGAELRRGAEVRLRISSGPAEIAVPDVTGLDESSATAQLAEAGFEVQVTDESTTDPSRDGLVVRQSPQGGSTAGKGEVVTITVARVG